MQAGDALANGRYVLERRLTRTGMAEVWVGSQRGSGGFSKPVVVKMIHPDLNEQEEARQRFMDEAHITSQISHPHVVQIYDFGQQDDLFYLVMEFIEGFDLGAIIKQAKTVGKKIPISIACRLIADACKGLGFIHDVKDPSGQRLDLIHRDISPNNLVVSRSGVIKIIDFGIVKARDKNSRTRTGVIVGKLQYMSPEQLSTEELDHRADIYSLGLVLYELLTLETRFRGKNLLEIFYEALNEPPPKVVDKRPDCPLEMVDYLHKALAQKRDERYLDAYAMQEVFESYLVKVGVSVTQRQISVFLDDLFSDEEEDELDSTTRIDAGQIFDDTQGPEVVINETSEQTRPGFVPNDLSGSGVPSTFSGNSATHSFDMAAKVAPATMDFPVRPAGVRTPDTPRGSAFALDDDGPTRIGPTGGSAFSAARNTEETAMISMGQADAGLRDETVIIPKGGVGVDFDAPHPPNPVVMPPGVRPPILDDDETIHNQALSTDYPSPPSPVPTNAQVTMAAKGHTGNKPAAKKSSFPIPLPVLLVVGLGAFVVGLLIVYIMISGGKS